jgi:hypothetical protein
MNASPRAMIQFFGKTFRNVTMHASFIGFSWNDDALPLPQ